MKKLLSAILCCVMLFGLMIPMTVSADAPAYDGAKAMRIEFEDYASSVAVPLEDGTTDPTGPQDIDDNSTSLMVDTRGATVVSTAGFSFDIQFTAPAGMHQFTYAHGTSFSSASFAVNGAALSASATGAELSYPWDSKGQAYTGTVYFTAAGTQTLTVTVNYDSTRSGYLIMLDYFEVAPIVYPEVNVTNAENTGIDVAAFKSKIAIPSGTSIGTASSTTVNDKNYVVIDKAADADYTMEIPFEVAPGSAGYYNFNYWAGILSGASFTIKVDDTTLSANASSTTETVSWAAATYYESAAMVNLTEGPHTLKLIMGRRSSNGKISMVIGPFTFVPFVEAKTTVTNAANATIVPKNYKHRVAINGSYSGSTYAATSGNEYLVLDTAANDATYTLEIPFEVAAGSAGMYNFNYWAAILSGGSLTIKVDDTTLSANASSTTETSCGWADATRYDSAAMVNLTEGPHTLKLIIGRRTSNSRISTTIGPFTFVPFVEAKTTVTNAANATIVPKDYKYRVAINGSYSGSTSTATSGNEYLVLDTAADADYTMEIPFEVAAGSAGYYNFNYWAGILSGASFTIKVDDTTLSANASSAKETVSWAEGVCYESASAVNLTEGPHTLKLIMGRRSSTGKISMAVGPFTFVPEAVTTVTNAANATIVPKNHKHRVAINGSYSGSTSTATSGNEYLVLDTATDADYTMEIPFEVAAGSAGYYNFNYWAGILSGGSLTIKVDDTTLSANASSATETVSWAEGVCYESASAVNLTEGPHTLKLIMGRRSSTGKISMAVGPFTFVPFVMPSASVSATEEMLIEAEAYAPINAGTVVYEDTGVAEGTGASGGKFLTFSTSVDPEVGYTMTIPFTADDEGLYAVEYVTTSSFDNCPITVYVDETNATAGAASSTEGLKADMFSAYEWGGNPVKMTNAAGVVITAGDHNLVVKLGARPTNDVVKHLDYIKVTYIGEIPKLESDITFDDGVVTANVYLDEAVAGKAFIALYNGKEFVGMSLLADVDGTEFEVTMEDVEAGTFTEAKLFVWSDVESAFAPLIAPVTKGFGNN